MARTTTTNTAEPTPKNPSRDQFKETADSVVIAFIMAFIFRAFIIEAFVIPTGSMAATLYGKHGTIVCTDCGWEFAYGLLDPSDPGTPKRIQSDPRLAVKETDYARCPNCRHPNTPLKINDVAIRTGGRRPGLTGNPQSGDRILVQKWPLDLGIDFMGPQRWDVTVFKDPRDGTTNYIKRLVGLPNEVLEILDGDIYTVPWDEMTQQSKDTLDYLRQEKFYARPPEHRDRPGLFRPPFPDRRHRAEVRQDLNELLDELNQKLTIRRKTRKAQQALWYVVYDHDYPPRERDPGQPYWEPLSGRTSKWSTGNRRLTFDGVNESWDAVSLHLDSPVSNACAYNRERNNTLFPVTDLRVRCVALYRAGDGKFGFQLTKDSQLFKVSLNAAGGVELIRDNGPGKIPTNLGTANIAGFQPDRAVEISFENVDRQISLYVDGSLVLQTRDDQYPVDIGELRIQTFESFNSRERNPTPVIFAENLSIELRHVAVDRDQYYTIGESGPPETRWGNAGKPIWLREGEYFMLGDNSPQSHDSRMWAQVGDHLEIRGQDVQRGVVPEDQLIGRAFFVYWPAALRPDWLSWVPPLRKYGVVPNFGRMRWIR